jgi:acyl-coenzyme A synthetase/AMP-(fatty) acid ligase/acyl carrier protein
MLQVFLESNPGELGSLRHVLSGGEALPYQVQQKFLAGWPAIALHNLYGPTEAAVYVTKWDCASGVHEGIVPIGHPLANTQMYVLDAQSQLVPAGVTGELYIGGRAVARGYLDNETLTNERFVADPFSAEDGARLYRTGDLARWLPDGAIEYLGRNDSQVKIRGFRIELGEIESQLRTLAGVQEAAVLAREDEPGHKRLVAYVVAQDRPADEAALAAWQEERANDFRRALQGQLPQYMVPTVFVLMAAFPLNSNGKLDRKALPPPQMLMSGEYVAPRTATELSLAQIWGEVLKRDASSISATDNFFDLGGHSLMIIRLLELIRQQLDGTVSMREIFLASSLAKLSEKIDAARSAQKILLDVNQPLATEESEEVI